ncbi:(2Fe-2S)-binding protein [Fusibacter sp. JL216-2]|uniref:(2Fe-2S)-binding protein n=1 Tax=Fusibacter sp. JL216-2 TaxID=3071453 RepID=UPI003D32567D
MEINVIVNGETRTFDAEPGQNLVSVLRENGYTEVRTGCDTGSCGLCTVWIDGKPTLSCSTLAMRVNGKKITTIKGVGKMGQALAEHLIAEGADQCGYCSPGFILTVLAMKNELKNPTEEDVKHYLNGNLCRCTGYEGQTRAIMKWLVSQE